MLKFIIIIILIIGYLGNIDGRNSKNVSGILIFLGLTLIIYGLITKHLSLNELLFLTYSFVCNFIFTRIYNISFELKNLNKILVFFILFGICVSFLLFKFSLQNYIIEFLVLTVGLIKFNYDKQKNASSNPLLTLNKSIEELQTFKTVVKKILRFYFISSTLYIIVIIGTFYILNSNLF